MAQWRNLEELSRTNKDVSERIDLIYNNDSFVFKIRTLCADFIEKDNWVDSISSDGSIQQDWFGGLLESLEDIGQCGDLKHKMSVKHDTQALKAMSEDEAYSFVQIMKRCIKQEQQLIQSFLCQPDDRRASTANVATENVKITAEMDQSAQALVSLEQKVSALVKEQENFNVFLAESTAKIEELRGQTTSAAVLELKQLEEQKTALIQNLYQNHRQIVAEQLEELDGPLGHLLDNVWADIDAWKKQQLLQITGLAKPPDRIMDVLGQMCERVGELLCTAQRLAEHVLNIYKNLLFQNDPLVAKVTEVANHLDAHLQKHVLKIFVVDKPPPQIIKVVNTKSGVFSMAVRLLGAASLGLPGTIKVTAELLREKDVETAMAGDQVAGMCQVVNGKDKIMETSKTPMSGCSTKTGTLVANFTKVCLEKAQRTERSRDDLVTDNKYFMVFYTQIVLHNKPMQLVTHSLPIILISHVLQDCTARATLVWNTAFPLENGRPFEEEKEVCWARVAEVLDALFYVNTERHLTPEQLTYLATIAFRKRDENTNFSEMMISRAKLLKDHLHKANNRKENPSRNFPFWKWFYANMNLLKERLKREWKDGIIYGFVSKAHATKLLTDQPDGTFLLRFSESSIEASMKADICGCITVAVTTPNPQTGELDVFHVKDHLATKDIINSSLAQILDSFEFDDAMGRKQRLLHYLWPNRTFEEVFKAYLPQRENKDDPYKQGRVTITILLCSDESRLRRGSQAMSPRSVVSDLDDMSTIASPGSVTSVQSPGVAVPTPSNVVTISDPNMFQNIVPAVGTNAQVFVPDRLQAQLPDLNPFNMEAFLQIDQNGDVMLSPDFQMDSVSAMDS